MPAVETQQLADLHDLEMFGPPDAAISMLSFEIKIAQLRKASGKVLAAYAKRFPRAPGASFTLAKWGDLTKGLVVALAVYDLFAISRGFNPETADGRGIKEARDEAMTTLDEIADITNRNARIDPDAVGSPDHDDEGPLGGSEGGCADQADNAATRRYLTRIPPEDCTNSPYNGIGGGGSF